MSGGGRGQTRAVKAEVGQSLQYCFAPGIWTLELSHDFALDKLRTPSERGAPLRRSVPSIKVSAFMSGPTSHARQRVPKGPVASAPKASGACPECNRRVARFGVPRDERSRRSDVAPPRLPIPRSRLLPIDEGGVVSRAEDKDMLNHRSAERREAPTQRDDSHGASRSESGLPPDSLRRAGTFRTPSRERAFRKERSTMI